MSKREFDLARKLDLREGHFHNDFEVIERHLVAAFAELGYAQREPRVFVSQDDTITVNVDPAGKIEIVHKRGSVKAEGRQDQLLGTPRLMEELTRYRQEEAGPRRGPKGGAPKHNCGCPLTKCPGCNDQGCYCRDCDICTACKYEKDPAECGEGKTEVSPPGFSGTTKAMKKHGDEIDNPFALSWHMYNKGDKPHKPTEPGKPAYTPPGK